MKIEYLTLVASAIVYLKGVSGTTAQEYGTYTNPNPRAYDKCGAQDLINLSNCCNDVLFKLDDCKADDLACECCALQSMKEQCYNLCPGNPSANFLTVLFEDCASLQDINACGLPFKKEDEDPEDIADVEGKLLFKSKSKNKELAEKDSESSVTIKSKISSNLENSKTAATKVDLLVDGMEVVDVLDPHTNDNSSDIADASREFNTTLFNTTGKYTSSSIVHTITNKHIACEDNTSGSSQISIYSVAYSILAVSLSIFVYEIL